MTFEEKALAAGGHLADDVAAVMLDVELEPRWHCGGLYEFVISNNPEYWRGDPALLVEDPALD